MHKYITFSLFLWTYLAAGFAGNDFKPKSSSGDLASVLMNYFEINENMLAATLTIVLCALHFFPGRKSTFHNALPDGRNKLATSAAISTNLNNRPTIAIIDDDIFMRESWELFVQDFNLITFDSPESFLLALDRNTPLIAMLDAIVVDYDFGIKSTMSGGDLAAILRQKNCSPIILCTNRVQKDIPDFDIFDLHLDKNRLDWHGLQKLLPGVISG